MMKEKRCKASCCRKRVKDRALYCEDHKGIRKTKVTTTSHTNHCKHCNSPTSNKHFCSRECQKRYALARKWRVFPNTGFGRYLAAAILRSGTVETLIGNDEYLLGKLFRLYKMRQRANGFGDLRENRYELCHLAPAVTKTSVGVLREDNLFIGESTLNRKLSNKSFGHTAYINKDELLDRWKLGSKMSRKQVLELADKYLQGELRAFVESQNIKPVPTSTDSEGLPPLALQDVLPCELLRLQRVSFDRSLTNHITSYFQRLEDTERWFHETEIGEPQLPVTELIPFRDFLPLQKLVLTLNA